MPSRPRNRWDSDDVQSCNVMRIFALGSFHSCRFIGGLSRVMELELINQIEFSNHGK
jgi:hypothetical protein